MLFLLLTPFSDEFIVFNLFRYLTFRTGGALLTALIFAFVFARMAASRSAATARKAISPSAAPPPWAA